MQYSNLSRILLTKYHIWKVLALILIKFSNHGTILNYMNYSVDIQFRKYTIYNVYLH